MDELSQGHLRVNVTEKSPVLMPVVIMELSAEQVEEAVHLSCRHQAASQEQSIKPISQYLSLVPEVLLAFLAMVL